MKRLIFVVLVLAALVTPVRLEAQVGPAPITYSSMAAIPDTCANVIEPGQTVTWSGTMTLDCATVKGALFLADGLNLTITTLRASAGGTITTSEPVGRNIRITFTNAPLDTAVDPEQYLHGLLVDNAATLKLKGESRTPWVLASGDIQAGATSITLASPPSGWQVGDELVIPGTNQPIKSQPAVSSMDETVTIATVAGSTVTLAAPVRFAHMASRGRAGSIRDTAPIGNLTRSITIASANPAGVRGHMLVTQRANLDLQYVALLDLGRTRWQTLLDSTTFGGDGRAGVGNPVTHVGTNQIGRYTLHLHHLTGPVTPQANGYQFTVVGNVSRGGSKWGFTMHDAHWGLMQGNVSYQDGGAGFMTEDGSETGNRIDGNLAVRPLGSGTERGDERRSVGEFGYEGSGFWFRGPNNRVTNNLAFNCGSYCYTVMAIGASGVKVPRAQGADPMVDGVLTDMTATPLREFSGNVAGASAFALTIWDIGAECCAAVHELPESVVDRFVAWHVYRAYYGYGHNRLTFDRWRHTNDPASLRFSAEASSSLFFSDYLARNTIVKHATIEHVRVGIYAPGKAGDVRDIYGAAPGTFRIEDSTFLAQVGLWREMQWAVTGGGDKLPPRLVEWIRNVFTAPTYDIGGGVDPYVLASLWFPGKNNGQNPAVSDRLVVEAFQGVTGDDFESYYEEQSDQAIAGGLAPCTAERPFVIGLVCGGVVIPVPPPAVDQVCRLEQGSESGWIPVPGQAAREYRTRVDTVSEVSPAANGGAACVPPVGTETLVTVEGPRPIAPPPPPPPPVDPNVDTARILAEMKASTDRILAAMLPPATFTCVVYTGVTTSGGKKRLHCEYTDFGRTFPAGTALKVIK